MDSNSPDNHDNIWDIKPEATRELWPRFQMPWVALR